MPGPVPGIHVFVAGFHFARFDKRHAITGILSRRPIDGIIATRVRLLPSK
jgi:hypothetical protein